VTVSRRIVGFLDVLGFKELVRAASQEELVALYRQLQEAARLQSTLPVFPDDPRRWDHDAYYDREEIQRTRVVNIAMASDSILVYAQGDGWQDVLPVCMAVQGLLMTGFRLGIPLRGAVTVGELDEVDLEDDVLNRGSWTASFSGIVGRGLVDAYTLESQADWSGVVFHEDLVAHLDKIELLQFDEGPFTALHQLRSGIAVMTDVPLKSGRKRMLALDWPAWMPREGLEVTEAQVADAFKNAAGEVPSEAVTKQRETLEFIARAAADRGAFK
jgi:hypothetical protein